MPAKNSRSRLREILRVLARCGAARNLTPEKLRAVLEELGPTFVKFGQILSMRPDIIPAEYCEELTKLRGDVRPMAFSEVRRVLEEEYGAPPEDFFVELKEAPFGSASIAQVHRAVLKDDRAVVVKVQRPGIYETMAQDARLLHRISGLLRIAARTGKVVDLDAAVDEMWAAAQQEMDFLVEAEHIREFADRNADVRYVAFPAVESALTTRRVLVMEMVEGIAVDDAAALQAGGYDTKEVAVKIGANYLKQVVEDGLFHADPHPGNIRLRGGKIVWLDLGMVGRLSARHRQLFREAVSAAADNDAYALTDVVAALGSGGTEMDRNRLQDGIGSMLSRYGTMDLGEVDAGMLLMELLRIADESGIHMPPGITMLARGVMTLEGVLSKVDPETSFMSIVAARAADAWQEDVEHALKHSGRVLRTFGRRAMDIPVQLSDVLRAAARGQSKLNIEVVGSGPTLSRFERIINRVVVGMLAGCLVIGSSILCTTDMTPRLLGIPLLGILGYAAAFIMIVWLTVRILHARKR